MGLNILECLSNSFNKIGYGLETDGIELWFHPLNLKINGVLELGEQMRDDLFHARLKIELFHEERFEDGISEYAYGWGENQKEAVENATDRWLSSDFPAIHDLLCTHHCDAEKDVITLASYSGKLDDVLEWRLVKGPIEGTGDICEMAKAEGPALIVKVLFQAMTDELLAIPELYAIKCFVSKNEENEIEVDCRINGEVWELGYKYLYLFADGWAKTDHLQYLKQYLILAEEPITDMEKKLRLYKELTEEVKNVEKEPIEEIIAPKKEWWKFWK